MLPSYISSCIKFTSYFFLPHFSTNGQASASEISQTLPSASHSHNSEAIWTSLHSLHSLSGQTEESNAIVTAAVHTNDLQPYTATILEESIHRYPRTYSTQFPQPSTTIYPRTYSTHFLQLNTSIYSTSNSTKFPQPSTSRNPATYSTQFPQPSTTTYPRAHSTQFPQPSTNIYHKTYSTQVPQLSTSIYSRPYSTQFPQPSTNIYPRTYSTQFPQPSTSIYPRTYSTRGQFLQPSSSSVITLYTTLSMPPRGEESLNTLVSIHRRMTPSPAGDDPGVSNAPQWPFMFGISMGSFLFIFFIIIIVMVFVVIYTRRHREASKLPATVEMFVNTTTTEHQNTPFGKHILM